MICEKIRHFVKKYMCITYLSKCKTNHNDRKSQINIQHDYLANFASHIQEYLQTIEKWSKIYIKWDIQG